MSRNTTTFEDARRDRLAPNGMPSWMPGPFLVGEIRLVRFRSLAGGLTKLSGLRTLTPSSRRSDPATMTSSSVKPKPSASNPQEGEGNG